MDSLLQAKCDALIENKKIITESFRWACDSANLAAAYLFAAAGQRPDPTALKEAEALLKEKTGAFSLFRGNIKVPIISKMLLSGQGAAFLEASTRLLDLLQQSRWQKSELDLLAAMTLADGSGPEQEAELAARTQEIFQQMKTRHPWLNSNEDRVFAAILARTDRPANELTDEAERCYTILKGRFGAGKPAKSLSQVLALGEAPAEEKCAKAIRLFDALKAAGHKYGKAYHLASLGPLVLLKLPDEQLVAEIAAADEYLAAHKGFGNFRLGAEMRRMYAAQMVLLRHTADSAEAQATVLGSILAFTIAMEIASIVIITSSTTTVITTMN